MSLSLVFFRIHIILMTDSSRLVVRRRPQRTKAAAAVAPSQDEDEEPSPKDEGTEP